MRELIFHWTELTLTSVVALVLLVIVAGIAMEVYSYNTDTETYTMARHIHTAEAGRYIYRSTFPLLLSIAGLLLVFLRFRYPLTRWVR
ncbi:MAG: hypothetical protein WBB45_19195 [Cyclobacteriaceae bacterium]